MTFFPSQRISETREASINTCSSLRGSIKQEKRSFPFSAVFCYECLHWRSVFQPKQLIFNENRHSFFRERGNPWNWAVHDGFIKKKKAEHQLQGEKKIQSLFLHSLYFHQEICWTFFPMVFHGLHGRKGLHQVETCSKIVFLWCSVALLISESPGWELVLDWITRGCGFSQSHHQHPWHTGWAMPCTGGAALTAALTACKILKSCNCLTNIYSASAYGLDFVFCSQLEGHFSSGKHRRNLVWLGQNSAWDPLRRRRCHGSFAVPSAGARAAVATLRQLCWSVKVSCLSG